MQRGIQFENLQALKQDESLTDLDTATILKRRCARVLQQNREKMKILESYTKNLSIIQDAFHMIINSTGITSIQEITNTFIKAEEQNYSL